MKMAHATNIEFFEKNDIELRRKEFFRANKFVILYNIVFLILIRTHREKNRLINKQNYVLLCLTMWLEYNSQITILATRLS